VPFPSFGQEGRSASAHAGAPAGIASGRAGIAWQPWSAEAVEQVRATGRPALVDFTARWCLTCQANEQFALAERRFERRRRAKPGFRRFHRRPPYKSGRDPGFRGPAGAPAVPAARATSSKIPFDGSVKMWNTYTIQ
jgi:hypothetical protein